MVRRSGIAGVHCPRRRHGVRRTALHPRGQRIGLCWALIVAFAGWAVATSVMIPALPVPTFAAAIANGLLFSGMPTLFTFYVVSNTTAVHHGPSFAWSLLPSVSPR